MASLDPRTDTGEYLVGDRPGSRGDLVDPDRVVTLTADEHDLVPDADLRVGTAVDELERRDASTALITMCTGGGMGTATIIERI